jgi:endonuclease-3 related protein
VEADARALSQRRSPVFQPSPATLRAVFDRLLAAYGAQHWWPADSPFEVAIGAVLTQNTAWSNVERAIANLKAQGLLCNEALLACTPERLAEAIRPSGYFNVKARRLQALCRFLAAAGGLEGLGRLSLEAQRGALLEVHGIGPETADDILLYALGQPVFVIDVYTRRLLQRLGLATGGEPYEVLRQGIERALGPDVAVFNEYHALIVRHAKISCRKSPRCADCVLRPLCPAATA